MSAQDCITEAQELAINRLRAAVESYLGKQAPAGTKRRVYLAAIEVVRAFEKGPDKP